MTRWQRRVRLVIGVSAVAFAAVVAVQFKDRIPAAVTAPVKQTDTNAVAQTDKGRSRRFNLQKEDVSIEYDKLLSYADGSSRMQGLKVITKRAGNRTFTITANEGRAGKDESDLDLTGDVIITSTDGIELKTPHATYTESDGMVRADGPVSFTRGTMTGSGVGATYDKNHDVLAILSNAIIHVPPDDARKGRLDIDSGAAEFVRTEHIVRFTGGLKARQDTDTMEADEAVAHLSEDEQRLEALDLRGHSKVTGLQNEPGTLKALSGQDIDLKYAPQGNSLQSAAIRANAAIDVAGERGQSSRQITANTIDVAMAADGTTATGLQARTGVRLVLPASKDEPARTITADAMDGSGKEGQGLTAAHFTGNVQLVERGRDISRTARSSVLDVSTGRGLSTIDEARFSRAVRFEEEAMTATAAAARYVLAKGTLELSGSEPGAATPRVINERMDTAATRIDVTLDGPIVHALGNVQSTLRPPKTEPGGKAKDGPKVPAMLKADQEVAVTAAELAYDGRASQARYSGNAVLFQAETKIKGAWIGIDDKSGDLTSGGGVTTTTMLKQVSKDGKSDRMLSTGTGKDFRYEDSTRTATYTSSARLVGPQGDVKADTILLFLKAEGDEVDRAEAHGNVTVIDEKNRKSTGTDLKYFSADERYEMIGKPVVIIDQCARPTEGMTLTFFRATDTVILTGTSQNMTRTRSDGTACP